MLSPAAHERWIACAIKRCCTDAIVFPTGDEVVALARRLGIPAHEVALPYPWGRAAPDAFRLAPGAPALRLALPHVRLGADVAAGCAYLMRLPNGSGRCGLGDWRPRRCRAYPAIVRDGTIVADGSLCACGAWTDADLDRAAAHALLAEAGEAYRLYAGIVAAWNAAIDASGTERTHVEFCAHLDAVYG